MTLMVGEVEAIDELDLIEDPIMLPPELPRRPSLVDRVDHSVLTLDYLGETEHIVGRMREIVWLSLKRRGAVVAVSGGIDSSVCLALAVRAFGADKVFAISLPERESSDNSRDLARVLAQHCGVELVTQDITPALEGVGCYRMRDEAIRQMFPEYESGWKNKIVIAGGIHGGLNFFKLVVQDPEGRTFEKRLPHRPYLQIVAAQNYKQRVRKMVEYFHADRLNYAVLGTPNRLEYDQGFFVKNGDGAADIKPIAHLYKSQVYALARHLGLPEVVCAQQPTTDTYSLQQGQDEFYFALPYHQMDLALWAYNHKVPEEVLARSLGISREQATLVYRDIKSKRDTTRPLHARPQLVRAVDEVKTI
jgi:NAD+ synthase